MATHSISVRLQRVTTEECYVSVPVTDAVLADGVDEEGRRHLDGQKIFHEAIAMASDTSHDLGLEQLHLELRSGQGLEGFYESSGWREIGRWPAALRLSAEDDRDEVLMLLQL